MNEYAEKLIARLASTRVEKMFIDGCCSVPGCYDKPVVILIDGEDDYQLCQSCYERYLAALTQQSPR